MLYLVYFLAAVVCTFGMHSYLLYSQRNNRKWSISVHAVTRKESYYLYLIGHILGGAFFVLFARSFLLEQHNLTLIFYMCCLAVVFEYIQAILPAKGKTNALHSIAAYIMWVLFISFGVMSYLQLPLNSIQRILSGPMLLIALGMFIYVHINRKKLYLYQMWMMALVLTALLVMIY